MKTDRGKRIALPAGCVAVLLGAVIGGAYYDEIRAWYELRQVFDSLGRNEQGYSEYRHRQTGVVFVSLPGGAFMRGSPKSDELAEAGERPRHEVTLSPFLIAKYEITQAEWFRIMVDYRAGVSKFVGDTLPVERVWPGHCVEFCDKAGLALPTEAQWEYACRAGTTTRYSSGDEEKDLARVAWYHGNSEKRSHPVGEKPANAFGLHDMHGNVLEWCIDAYDAKFYSKPESRERDARNGSSSGYRTLRGGAYYSRAKDSRSAYREFDDPGIKGPGRGFRPVWPPHESER